MQTRDSLWRTRKLVIIFSILIVVLLPSLSGFNKWVARHSIEIATWITILPFPFVIEADYTDGTFQKIVIKSHIYEVFQMVKKDNCEFLIGQNFFDIQGVSVDQLINSQGDGEILIKCLYNGVSANQIITVEDFIITRIGLGAGIWI